MSKPSVFVSTPDLALKRAWQLADTRRWVTRHDAAFLALVLAATVWAWSPLTTVISRSWYSDDYQHYSHIVLIPVIALYLLFLNRAVIARSVTFAPATGSILLVLSGVLIWVAKTPLVLMDVDYRLSMAMAGLVLAWFGAFTLAYGGRALRAVLYPLAFLAFMVPMPPAVVHRVIVFLQHASAEISAVLFTVIGMPVFREGSLLFGLPGLTIRVAEECSGIRSSISLTITGVLIAYFTLRKPWARAAFMATIIPVAVFKNAVRIVVLSWLAVHVDPAFVTGGLTHRLSGIPVFLLALAILGGIVWTLRGLEGRAAR